MGIPADDAWERYCELRSPALAEIAGERVPSLDEASRLLWERSDDVARAEVAPRTNLEALARAGLYGLVAPDDDGGLGLGYDEACEVAEELAGSCTTTAFLWAQHLRLLSAMLSRRSSPALVAAHRAAVIAGRLKGGVVLTGLMPGPPRLVAVPGEGSWALHGQAPWFSGWGVVDLVVVVARLPDGGTASLLVPETALHEARVTPLALIALAGTRTVRLDFDNTHVPAGQVLSRELPDAPAEDAVRLRLNGSFPLGLARKCCALAGPCDLDAELAGARRQLRQAVTLEEVSDARARASALAVRAAQYLVVVQGSRSVLIGSPAERLLREASLFMVFGTRPAIRSALLGRLSRPAPAGCPPPSRPPGQSR